MVMAPIALALLKTDIPANLKYPILALATYVGSNLLVYAYSKTADSKFRRFDMRRMAVGIFLIGAGVTVTGVAQDQPVQKSPSATMNVYVFPTSSGLALKNAPRPWERGAAFVRPCRAGQLVISSMPHVQLPGSAETKLQVHEPPQLQ